MTPQIIENKISAQDIKKIVEENFGTMAKGAVDIERKIIALGGEMHTDANEVLLENGSEQKNVWGINIYPLKPKDEQIEFYSFINIRPSLGNRSMKIESEEIKGKIKEIVYNLIEFDGTNS